MRKARKDTGLFAYLDASGVLTGGNEEEIRAVRRAYRKQYLKAYKKKQRTEKPEFLVQLSKQNGEYGRITLAAKKHRICVSAFLRLATIAYIERSFLVPDRALITKLAALLSECLNEIRSLVAVKEKNSFLLESKFDLIENRIALLDTEIRKAFSFPPMLEAAVAEAIRTDPALVNRLLAILAHAHRED